MSEAKVLGDLLLGISPTAPRFDLGLGVTASEAAGL